MAAFARSWRTCGVGPWKAFGAVQRSLAAAILSNTKSFRGTGQFAMPSITKMRAFDDLSRNGMSCLYASELK
jgi:hypothetical protein